MAPSGRSSAGTLQVTGWTSIVILSCLALSISLSPKGSAAALLSNSLSKRPHRNATATLTHHPTSRLLNYSMIRSSSTACIDEKPYGGCKTTRLLAQTVGDGTPASVQPINQNQRMQTNRTEPNRITTKYTRK